MNTPGRAGGGRIGSYLQRNEFLRHVLTLMSGTTLAQIVLFLSTPLLTRMGMTDEEFGAYNAAFMSVAGFLIPVAALRYDMAIVLPRNDDDARKLFRITTALNTVVSCLAALALWIGALPLAHWLIPARPGQTVFAEDLAPWMPIAALIIWSYAQMNIVNYWSNRRKRYDVTSTNTMINSIGTAGGRLASVGVGMGPAGLALATLFGEFAGLANFFARSHRDVLKSPTTARSGRQLLRAYRKMPLLNAPNALVDAIRISGIPASLSHFFGSATTGAFQMAWVLVQTPMSLINAALIQVFFQKLSVTPRGRMFAIIKKSVVRSALLGLLPFALIWLLAPWFLPLFLGGKWHHAGVVASLLVPWLFVNFITSPISTVFVVARRQGLALGFALLYMLLPLGIIWTAHDDIDATLRLVAWSMGAILVLYIGLALWVAKAYDDGFGIEHDAEQLGESAEAGEAEAEERLEEARESVEAAQAQPPSGPRPPADA